MIGPTVGAFLIGSGGWRAIFAINVPLALLVYYRAACDEPGGRRIRRSQGEAGAGSVHLAAAREPRDERARERRDDFDARSSHRSCSRGTFGLALHNVGLAMAVGPLTTTLTAIPAGRFADRLNGRLVAVGGLTVFTLGAVGLALLRTRLRADRLFDPGDHDRLRLRCIPDVE